MRTQITETSIKLWLSTKDTYDWALGRGVSHSWPGSFLMGKRLFAEFDSNGLLDLTVNGLDNRNSGNPLIEGLSVVELNAITSDFLRDKLPEDHPLYFITVGQFTSHQPK